MASRPQDKIDNVLLRVSCIWCFYWRLVWTPAGSRQRLAVTLVAIKLTGLHELSKKLTHFLKERFYLWNENIWRNFSFVTYASVYKSLFMSSMIWLFEFYSINFWPTWFKFVTRGPSLLQICLHLPFSGGYFTVGSVGSTTGRQPLWNVYFRYHKFSDSNEVTWRPGSDCGRRDNGIQKVQGNTQQHVKTKQNLSLLRLSSIIYSCRPQKGFHYNTSLIQACDSPSLIFQLCPVTVMACLYLIFLRATTCTLY